LAISEIPWNGPLGGLRLAQDKDGGAFINPKNSRIKELRDAGKLSLEAFVAGLNGKINMIELAGQEVSEDKTIEALEFAKQPLAELIEFQEKIVKKVGVPKIKYEVSLPEPEFSKKAINFLKDRLGEAIYVTQKTDRLNRLSELKEELKSYLIEEGFVDLSLVDGIFEEKIDEVVRKNILESEKRPDGRRLDEIRELYAEVGLFRRLHGSGLFSRGNTQSLAVATLAAPGAEQMVETMEMTAKRRFMLHYNFPPYSVGEIGRLGAPGRREIGHGALAEKALAPLIPSKEEFPYTIRVVSEILSSNGSSSMATVSAASLALMDAGVPIKKPAAGIALGLMSDSRGHYKILTDIQGPEDHHGDMDLKIAGTEDGITAIQMDVKIEGLTIEILKETLFQAKKSRLEILNYTNSVLNKPRPKVSDFAPTIMTLDIRPEQIGEVIGPGGKIINGIIQATGVLSIDIEQTGKVFVAAADEAKAKAAIQQIKGITREFQVGEIAEGKVVKILDFGAIVDLGAGKDGMIHVSELKEGFVQKVEDVVKLGDHVRAKIVRVEDGRIALSLKQLRQS
jgi:polyribonucleotide nucleotidyltransferase